MRKRRKSKVTAPVHKRHNHKSNSHPSTIQSFIDWQDHAYDPGYYTGGRIWPIFSGKHPNKFGYFLIPMGVCWIVLAIGMVIKILISEPIDNDGLVSAVVVIVIGVLMVFAGIRLLRRA